MRDDEWDAWHARAVSEYADDMVRNEGADPRAGASSQAAEETEALLPDGLDTPGHHLFVAEDADTGQRVGHLWFGPRTRNPGPRRRVALRHLRARRPTGAAESGRAIDGLLRGRGAAPRVTVGSSSTSSATTRPAKHLYEAVGYVEMARQMGKDLDN